ncbi:molybdopterin cofactor-binding domain-containing protein [Parvularcula sp. IMCC14364]|uniref:xanthine dehydrogenase family protein molybdopterin-binding subunit n=1 Tax=Parvularcula sp. IMCC14364 TaxID=3067902 RepID=UPI0027407871|nr:molybdopterin cofactor-binding domain-containing protein [Parvularcula sp. IMCC14364]
MGKWTRRAFLSAGVIAGGGILVGVALRPGNRADDVAGLVEGDGEKLVHAYIKIDQDNVVTAIVPHSEMGQGAQTALAQMLADELDADWDLVKVEEAPAIGEYAFYSIGRGYLFKDINLPGIVVPTIEGAMMMLSDSLDLQVTGGSMSVRVTGTYGMRVAGAATRDMLKRAAAKEWGVPAAEITTEKSMLIHDSSSRREPYAAFAAAAAEMTPSYTPKLKELSDYKIMGKPVQRLDIPSKVDGSAMFALDIRLPGMVYATVTRSPVFGGKVVSVDDAAARAVNGVLDVIPLPASSADMMIGGFSAGEAVAVVANGYWAAQRGLRALDIQWDSNGNDAVSSAQIATQHQQDISLSADRKNDRTQGDMQAAFDTAEKVISAEYNVPYLAHTCMEPLNATAHVQDGKCEVWVGCQNPLGFRRAVAEALGYKEDQVTLNNLLMGGGFGRKSRPDWAIQAALLSKAVGKPVQLIWSREEDVRQDFYRPASRSNFRAAMAADGTLTAWENTYVNKQEPAEAPLIPYAVDAQDIGYLQSPSHVPWGAWRSVDESQHGFYTESFIDECAAAAGQDPLSYRAELLKDHPRHLAVLDRVAREANWSHPLKQGQGRGVAIKESFGSIVAQVAEISLVNNEVVIDRMVAVIDPGFAVSPDGVVAQIESGIIYGLTAAIYGEITIEDGAVKQSNFHDYQALRMTASPLIETHIINSGFSPGGAGEPGTPPAAPALANAIFAATGRRIRELPLSKHIQFTEGYRA